MTAAPRLPALRRRAPPVSAVLAVLLVVGLFPTVIAAPAALATPAATNPFFGTWYDGLSPEPAAARTDLDAIAAAGIGTIRQYVFWDRVETSPGTYDWSRVDQLVTDATARGITVLPTLLYTPSFYAPSRRARRPRPSSRRPTRRRWPASRRRWSSATARRAPTGAPPRRCRPCRPPARTRPCPSARGRSGTSPTTRPGGRARPTPRSTRRS